jgi:hypothetical protein
MHDRFKKQKCSAIWLSALVIKLFPSGSREKER